MALKGSLIGSMSCLMPRGDGAWGCVDWDVKDYAGRTDDVED